MKLETDLILAQMRVFGLYNPWQSRQMKGMQQHRRRDSNQTGLSPISCNPLELMIDLHIMGNASGRMSIVTQLPLVVMTLLQPT